MLNCFSAVIHHVGPLGAGQIAKTVNNILLWCNMRTGMEVLTLAKELGLDPEAIRHAMFDCSGDSWALRRLDRINPAWPAKDMQNAIILSESANSGFPMISLMSELASNLSQEAVDDFAFDAFSMNVEGALEIDGELYNSPPTIEPIDDLAINENGTGEVVILIDDAELYSSKLEVSADSSNPALVPVDGIDISPSGSKRTLAISPAANAFGEAVITVTVSDGAKQASVAFTVTVNEVTGGVSGVTGAVAYLQAWIDGASTYRIAGNRGTARFINFTVQGPRPDQDVYYGADHPNLHEPFGDTPEANITGVDLPARNVAWSWFWSSMSRSSDSSTAVVHASPSSSAAVAGSSSRPSPASAASSVSSSTGAVTYSLICIEFM